ncbi:hemerythrin domain-containing protein [Aquirhabdus sp.]|uniref:hemerythrin domain-containing protein n=1 Tax=Aquirhabdus sp. TaxID=2824160 RepID=UPI00396CC0C0
MSLTIYEALRQSHEIQRDLYAKLLKTQGDSTERDELFTSLKIELAAHAAAEERHFLIPLLVQDSGINISRHAISEHHELDELVEKLEETDYSNTGWLANAKALADEIEHHLGEEEHGFFQFSGKLLTDKQKTDFAQAYLTEYDRLKVKFAEGA